MWTGLWLSVFAYWQSKSWCWLCVKKGISRLSKILCNVFWGDPCKEWKINLTCSKPFQLNKSLQCFTMVFIGLCLQGIAVSQSESSVLSTCSVDNSATSVARNSTSDRTGASAGWVLYWTDRLRTDNSCISLHFNGQPTVSKHWREMTTAVSLYNIKNYQVIAGTGRAA